MKKQHIVRTTLTAIICLGCSLVATAASAADFFSYVGQNFTLSYTLVCTDPSQTQTTVDWVFSGGNHDTTETIFVIGLGFGVNETFTAPTRGTSALSVRDIGGTGCGGSPVETGDLITANYPFTSGQWSVSQTAPIMTFVPANTWVAYVPFTISTYVGQDPEMIENGPPTQDWQLDGSSGPSDPSITGSLTGCEAGPSPLTCYMISNLNEYTDPGTYTVLVYSTFAGGTAAAVSLPSSTGITIVDGSQYFSSYVVPAMAAYTNLP